MKTDIFISGGGIAGLSAAIILGAEGHQVVLADPMQAPKTALDADADLRSTAFLQPAVAAFTRAGLWERLRPEASALEVMRLVDLGGETTEPRHVADFRAEDISDAPFGWNLPNWLIRSEMLAHAQAMDTVTILIGRHTTGWLPRSTEARITLDNGTKISAKLVLAADGRDSPLRDMAGITAKRSNYDQKAVVFAVSHDVPHGFVSTEFHRSGGPFTLVPMPDADGLRRSSVVWMEHSEKADALMALDEEAFNRAATDRSGGMFGALKLLTGRKAWPIITQHAAALTGERLALIAEAAHVVPPIGAQGLNMSLADITMLRDLMADAVDIGGQDLLARYARARRLDTTFRMTGIDLLSRAAMTDIQAVKDLRLQGLKAIHGIDPVRKSLMRLGLGAR